MKVPRPAPHLLSSQEQGALSEIWRERHALERRRVVWWTWAAVLALFSLWTSPIYVGSSGDDDFKLWHAPAFGLVMAAIFGFFVYLGIGTLASWVTERGRARALHAYLRSIDYPEREGRYNAERKRLQERLDRAPQAGPSRSGGTKAAQHEWYDDHPELTWRHREQARRSAWTPIPT